MAHILFISSPFHITSHTKTLSSNVNINSMPLMARSTLFICCEKCVCVLLLRIAHFEFCLYFYVFIRYSAGTANDSNGNNFVWTTSDVHDNNDAFCDKKANVIYDVFIQNAISFVVVCVFCNGTTATSRIRYDISETYFWRTEIACSMLKQKPILVSHSLLWQCCFGSHCSIAAGDFVLFIPQLIPTWSHRISPCESD